MIWLFLLYLITGPCIFAYNFGQSPTWRKELADDGECFIVQVIIHLLFWPFLLISKYFWKDDDDETSKAGKDSE